MNHPSTVREWLETLPEPYRGKALSQCDEEMLDTSAHSLLEVFSEVLLDTIEGYSFWEDTCMKVMQGVVLPLDI